MRGTILCGNNLPARFKHLLKTHTHVDIATAWATGGGHLRALADAASRERRGVEVRAIVGIAGNATRPDALEELSRITAGDLRIVLEGDRLFHPKLYLFGRHRDGIVTRQAWIGKRQLYEGWVRRLLQGERRDHVGSGGRGSGPMRLPLGSNNAGISVPWIPLSRK